MGRDRFVKTEWGDQKNPNTREFGFCDHGFRLQTREEAEIYQALKDQGYQVTKHGYPDLLATKGDEVRFIEVKSTADKGLQKSQKRVFAALKRKGIIVEILLCENPNRPYRYSQHKEVI